MIKTEQYRRFELESEKEIKFTSPSGKSITAIPFVNQSIKFEYDDEGAEMVTPNGAAKMMVRFYPNEIGVYKYDGGEFECVKSADKGYIRVSENDGRYFSYTDGDCYNPIGVNLAFLTPFSKSNGEEFGCFGYKYLGMRQYESWFSQCRKNGVNLVRIWLGHEYLSPDTQQAGEFDFVQFAKIDALLELARKYGIKLKLTLEQFRFFDYETLADSNSYSDDVFRKFNKNLYIEKRRCESVDEWLTDNVWREKWLDKVRQFAYRYSGDTAIFAVELWNEMNCLPRKSVLEWNRYMLPEVKKLFPNHLVLNSIGSFDCDEVLTFYDEFVWELSDIKQMHRYLDQGAKYDVCRNSPIDLVRDGVEKLADKNKPFFLAETGAVNNCHSGPFRYYNSDHRGIIFCDTVYTPIFCGAAGCGHIWHWDGRYLESKNLYKYFKPIEILCENVEFDKEGFETGVFEDDDIILLYIKGKTKTLGYLRNKHDNWKNVLRDMKPEKVVDKKTIPFEFDGELSLINIWDGETADISADSGNICVKNLRYGMFLKFE